MEELEDEFIGRKADHAFVLLAARATKSLICSPNRLFLLEWLRRVCVGVFRRATETARLRLSVFGPALNGERVTVLFNAYGHRVGRTTLLFRLLVQVR